MFKREVTVTSGFIKFDILLEFSQSPIGVADLSYMAAAGPFDVNGL
jgi:hypothetical protein